MEATVKNDFLKTLIDTMNKRTDGLEQLISGNNQAMNKRVDGIETKIDGIGNQQELVLKRHEKAIARLERQHVTVKTSRKLAMTPNVIYLIALGSVMLLAIVASVLHVDLGALLR